MLEQLIIPGSGIACHYCGKEFVPKSKKGRFCSNRCRCAWNANKRRVEKRVQRAVVDALWLVDLQADDPTNELVTAAVNLIYDNLVTAFENPVEK